MSFFIDEQTIGTGHRPFIIAELSANHNGSLERALATIKAARDCGADAIKLQTYSADTMTIDCEREDFMIRGGLWRGFKLYDLYKLAETPFAWHRTMFEYAHRLGITIFSTPFDENAVDLLESLNTPAYKIASFEITDLPLIRYVARTGKPMIISTGMASEEEIAESVATAREAGCSNIVLLHCISCYPAPINQANLLQISELTKRFGVPAGLSDHTLGTTASVAAVALGACVIEKHFTLSRQDKGPDSEFSLEPEELSRLCREAKEAWLALGKPGFERQATETSNKIFRRSLYFIRDLPQGHTITPDDIRRIRPGHGLPPKYFEQVIGMRTKGEIKRGSPVLLESLENESTPPITKS